MNSCTQWDERWLFWSWTRTTFGFKGLQMVERVLKHTCFHHFCLLGQHMSPPWPYVSFSYMSLNPNRLVFNFFLASNYLFTYISSCYLLYFIHIDFLLFAFFCVCVSNIFLQSRHCMCIRKRDTLYFIVVGDTYRQKYARYVF